MESPLTTRDVCRRLGLPESTLRHVLRRLGAPRPRLHHSARLFLWTEEDVEQLERFLSRERGPGAAAGQVAGDIAPSTAALNSERRDA
jgi:hypothetical protein